MVHLSADLQQYWQQIVANPGATAAVIANLILIESLLSVDNAAVLATMVMDLPPKQRSRALRIGLIFAYLFRGLCLLFASYLIQIWWLKPLGGLYLLYLGVSYFVTKATPNTDDDILNKEGSWLYRHTVRLLGTFWATVALVETMDLAFSIDNVFAAVAFTENLLLVWLGVFIGILTMRLVAQFFVRLMERYPFLETSAFLVIAILGLKLVLSLVEHYYPTSAASHILASHQADHIISALTVGIFFVPILTSTYLGFPKRK